MRTPCSTSHISSEKRSTPKIFLVAVLCVCLLGSGVAFSHQATDIKGSDFEARLVELEKEVLGELAETRTPGAAIGIVKGNRLIYARGIGVSNVETGAPVTPEMLFRLGSTTKMFTAHTRQDFIRPLVG